jgi:hypothetical protein
MINTSALTPSRGVTGVLEEEAGPVAVELTPAIVNV